MIKEIKNNNPKLYHNKSLIIVKIQSYNKNCFKNIM